MTGTDAPFAVSIVVEWENAGRIGDERARAMLRTLHEQIAQADPALIASSELILTYAQCADPAPIDHALAEAGRGAPWRSAIRHAPAPDGGYYALKNHGAALALGDVVILLDSDVIPQPGWLDRIVATFRDPSAEIVCGATWTDHRGLYSSAMALGWTFPVRPDDDAIVPTNGFQANNVAFRPHLRATMSFPATSQYRGQGVAVIERLKAEGRTVLMNRGAQVSHPPPAGFAGFATRALWSGYDLSVASRSAVLRGIRNVARTGALALFSVATQFRKVRLGPLGAVGAAAIVGTYHGLRGAGFVAGLVAPGLLRRTLTRIAP